MPQINHINGIKTDNHAYDTGLTAQGEDRVQSKLSNTQVEWCRAVYIPDDHEFGQAALAKKLGVSQKTIANVVLGKCYKQVGGQIHQRFYRRIPESIRQEIRKLFVKGSSEFGACALARKFGISKSTVLAIVKD